IEEKAEFGYFICTGGFASTALKNAEKNKKIKCIDMFQLKNLMQEAYPNTDDLVIELSCLECGESVYFSLIKKKSQEICPNGHVVANNIWAYCNIESDKICPRCGKIIIEKRGRYGKYYGCNNSKCNYSRNTYEEFPFYKK
ncbi:MAG: topoisomerase DNA-binding C4 zinc finger domain-containing protein, partial [Bacillota bacterium]